MRGQHADGAPVGEVTSGTFSPTLQARASGWPCSTAAVAEGDEVVVDVRGRGLRCRVVKPPFVQTQTRTP